MNNKGFIPPTFFITLKGDFVKFYNFLVGDTLAEKAIILYIFFFVSGMIDGLVKLGNSLINAIFYFWLFYMMFGVALNIFKKRLGEK